MLVKNIKSNSSKKKGTNKNKKKETKKEQIKMGFEMPDDDEFEEEVMRQLQQEEAKRKDEQKIKFAKKQNMTKNELKPLQIQDMSQFEQQLRSKEQEVKIKQMEKEKKLQQRQKLSQTINPIVIGIDEIQNAGQQLGDMVEKKSQIIDEAQQRVRQGEDSVVRISESHAKINQQNVGKDQQTIEQQTIERESERIAMAMREKDQHDPIQEIVVLAVQNKNGSEDQIQIEQNNENQQIKLLDSGCQHHLNEENLKYEIQECQQKVGEKQQKTQQNALEHGSNALEHGSDQNIRAESLEVLEVSSPQLQRLIHDDKSKGSSSNNQSEKRSSPQVSDSYIPLNEQRQQRQIKEQAKLENQESSAQLMNKKQIQQVGIEEQTQAQEFIQQPLISLEPQTLLRQQKSVQQHQQEQLTQNQQQKLLQPQQQKNQEEYKPLTQQQQLELTDLRQDETIEHKQLQNNEKQRVQPLKGEEQLQEQKPQEGNRQNSIQQQQTNAQQPQLVINESIQPKSQHQQHTSQQQQHQQTIFNAQLSHTETQSEQQGISSQIKQFLLLEDKKQLQEGKNQQIGNNANKNDRAEQIATEEPVSRSLNPWKQVQQPENQVIATIDIPSAQDKKQEVLPTNVNLIHQRLPQPQRVLQEQSMLHPQKAAQTVQSTLEPFQKTTQTGDKWIVSEKSESNEVKPEKSQEKFKKNEGNNKTAKSKTSKKAKPKSTIKLIQSNLFEEQEQVLQSNKEEDPLLHTPAVDSPNQQRKQLIEQESKKDHNIQEIKPQVQQIVTNNEGNINNSMDNDLGYYTQKSGSLTVNNRPSDSQNCKSPEQSLAQEIPSNNYADQPQQIASSEQNMAVLSSKPSNQSSQKLSPSETYPAQPVQEQQEEEQEGLSVKASMKPKQNKKGGKKGNKSTKKPTNNKKSIIDSGSVFEQLELETIEQKVHIDHPASTQKPQIEGKQPNSDVISSEVANQTDEIKISQESYQKQSLQQKQLDQKETQRQQKEEEPIENLSLAQSIQQQQIVSKPQQKIGSKLQSKEIFSSVPEQQPIIKSQSSSLSHPQANQSHFNDEDSHSNAGKMIQVKDIQRISVSPLPNNSIKEPKENLQEAEETVIMSNVVKKKKNVGNGTKKKPSTTKAKTANNRSKLSNISMDIDQFVVEEQQSSQIIDHPTFNQPVKNDIEENQDKGEINSLCLQKPLQHEQTEQKQLKTICEQKQVIPNSYPVQSEINHNLSEESKYEQRNFTNEEQTQLKHELTSIQIQQPKPLEQKYENIINTNVVKDLQEQLPPQKSQLYPQKSQLPPQSSPFMNQQRQGQVMQIKQMDVAKISLKGNTSKPAKKGSKKKAQSTKKSSKNKSMLSLDVQQFIQQKEQQSIEQKLVPQSIKENTTASKKQENQQELYAQDVKNNQSNRKQELKENQTSGLDIKQDQNINIRSSEIANTNQEYQDIREPQQCNIQSKVQPVSLQQQETKQTDLQLPLHSEQEPKLTSQSSPQSPKDLQEKQHTESPQHEASQKPIMQESKVELDVQLSIPTISKAASTVKKPLKKSSQTTKKPTKPTASKQKPTSLIIKDIQQMIEEAEENKVVVKTEIQRQEKIQNDVKESYNTHQIKNSLPPQSQHFQTKQPQFEQIPLTQSPVQCKQQMPEISDQSKPKEENTATNANINAQNVQQQIRNEEHDPQMVQVLQPQVKPQLENKQTQSNKPLQGLQSKEAQKGLNAKSQIQQPNEQELTVIQFEISKNKKKKPLTKTTKPSKNKQSSKPIPKTQSTQPSKPSKPTNFSQSLSLPSQFPSLQTSLTSSQSNIQPIKAVAKEQPKPVARDLLEKPKISTTTKGNRLKSKLIDVVVQETEDSPEQNAQKPVIPKDIDFTSNKSSQPSEQVSEKKLSRDPQQTYPNKPQTNPDQMIAAPKSTQKGSSENQVQKDKQAKTSKTVSNANPQPNQKQVPKPSQSSKQSQLRSLPVTEHVSCQKKVHPQQNALQSLLKSQLEMVRLNNDSNLQIIRQKIRHMKQALNDKLRRKLQRTEELQKLQSKNPAQQKSQDDGDDHNYGQQSVLRENVILKKQLYQRTSAH